MSDGLDPRPATADDLHLILALLESLGLPTADINPALLPNFRLIKDGDELLACCGLQACGSAGVIRSLATRPMAQNRGLARRLLKACEADAASRGLTHLYLLTTHAGPWFERHGYLQEARERVPAAVLAHPQFAGLCPVSAHCHFKSLSRKETIMKKLEVFDPAMCCATGVCGVEVDPVLVQFAADLKWLEEKGIAVARFNLGTEPQAFAANPAVLKEMEAGMDRLPILVVDGQIATTGLYPSRLQLAQKLGLTLSIEDKPHIKIGACCSPKSGCC